MALDPARLRQLPLFSSLSDGECEELSRWFQVREASAGEILMREGATGYTFFVIQGGTVEVARDGALLETLGPGDFFGEMAILGGIRRNASVTAATDAELLVMFGTEFRSLEEQLPGVAARITEVVAGRAARLDRPGP
jgi:CRP-like cAMP-binding protein